MYIKNTRSIIILCTILISILCPVSSYSCKTHHLLIRYNLPVYELETIISSWLKSTGNQSVRSVRQKNGVMITAQDHSSQWTILLQHYSPLSTDMDALCTTKENNLCDFTKLQSLKDYLAVYIQHSGNHAASGSYPQQDKIPDNIIAKADAVVCIISTYKGISSSSTGFIISDRGFILSVAHDKNSFAEIEITLNNGRRFSGRLIKKDSEADLALIRIERKGHLKKTGPLYDKYISLTNINMSLKQGDKLFSVGCPENMPATIFSGFVCGPPRLSGRLPLWQVCIDASPGGSGSPVFDIRGQLCGIVKGRYRADNSVGFIIPAAIIIDFLQ